MNEYDIALFLELYRDSDEDIKSLVEQILIKFQLPFECPAEHSSTTE